MLPPRDPMGNPPGNPVRLSWRAAKANAATASCANRLDDHCATVMKHAECTREEFTVVSNCLWAQWAPRFYNIYIYIYMISPCPGHRISDTLYCGLPTFRKMFLETRNSAFISRWGQAV